MSKTKVKAPLTFSATRKGLRQSARKARLVMTLVRGKHVPEALGILKFTHNRAARHIEKLINSAVANAENQSNRENLGIDGKELVICEAMVGDGFSFARWRSRSRGSASRYKRYFCNLYLKLCRPDDVDALKLYHTITSQKRRVDRIKDLKGLEVVAAKENE
ncbi:MAG: 50S ribosomal protein L22 [Planctomycetaceae bacterium]|nr:50S ribosomal protein L22 [Planctomycetaceae bacterium]